MLATLDAERNEVPHPYGSHIHGPSFIMYAAGDKHRPRLLPLRGGESAGGAAWPDAEDEEDAAPTLADVLVLLQRRGGRAGTVRAAGQALMAADQADLEGWGRGAAGGRRAGLLPVSHSESGGCSVCHSRIHTFLYRTWSVVGSPALEGSDFWREMSLTRISHHVLV